MTSRQSRPGRSSGSEGDGRRGKRYQTSVGAAGGRCSKPGCGIDLTVENADAADFVIGEMAHVIARSPDGPRGKTGGSDDSYANLILLCPTHHREVDKAPKNAFSEDTLLDWKRQHEDMIRNAGSTRHYESFEELAANVRMLLAENRVIWETFGPKSQVAQRSPGSNVHRVWELRRAGRIVPNNRKIINVIRANYRLLGPQQVDAFARLSLMLKHTKITCTIA